MVCGSFGLEHCDICNFGNFIIFILDISLDLSSMSLWLLAGQIHLSMKIQSDFNGAWKQKQSCCISNF